MCQKSLCLSEFAHLDLNKCIDTLVYGTTVRMIKNKNKNKTPAVFVFSLCEDNFNELQWIQKHKNKLKKMDLGMISSVSHYNKLKNETKPLSYDYNLILEIMYGKNQRLVLLFDDFYKKELFWCGLRHFIDKQSLDEITM